MKKLRKPEGWPKDIGLPSAEEIRQAVREAELMMEEILKKTAKELKGVSPEMLDTQITI
jgi:hypothetical protein